MNSTVPSAHARIVTRLNAMRCLCFIGWSLCLGDGGHLISLVENGFSGQIYAQPKQEVACGCGQPVGFMASRSAILDVYVDGTVGVRNEAGAVADAVPIERIPYKLISRVTHRERPERAVGWKA